MIVICSIAVVMKATKRAQYKRTWAAAARTLRRAQCDATPSEDESTELLELSFNYYYYYYYKIYIAHKSMEVHFQMRITRIKRTTLYTYSKNTNL